MNIEDIDCRNEVKGQRGSTHLMVVGCPIKIDCVNFGNCYGCYKGNKHKKMKKGETK